MARKYTKKAFIVRVVHADGETNDYYADQRGLTSIKSLFSNVFVHELDRFEADRFLGFGVHVEKLDK